MRERAAALGGTLRAGPRADGGFRVDAALLPPSQRGDPIGGARMIRVLLADDQALVRAGFRALLDAEPDIEVVGEAADGAEAVRLARQTAPRRGADGHPDARRRRPGGDPADRRRPGAGRGPGRHPDHVRPGRVRLRGAAGRAPAASWSRTPSRSSCCAAVRVVAAGDALLSPGVTRRLIARVRRPRPRQPGRAAGRWTRSPTGSARWWRWSATGLSNDEIAARLVVSPATAKTHVSRAMIKLGARDRAQLVVLAYEAGLVRPGWLG